LRRRSLIFLSYLIQYKRKVNRIVFIRVPKYFFYLLSTLSLYNKTLFDIIVNNEIYLKNILRKTRTKKLWNFSGALEFREEKEEEKFALRVGP